MSITLNNTPFDSQKPLTLRNKAFFPVNIMQNRIAFENSNKIKSAVAMAMLDEQKLSTLSNKCSNSSL